MTPSRSAQGQISSWVTPIRSITASATMAPASSLGRPFGRDAREPGPLGLVQPGQPLRPQPHIAVLKEPPGVEALARRRRPGDPGELPEGLRGADRVVVRAAAAQAARHPGDLRPHVPAQRAHLAGAGRVRGEPVPGEPAGAERQRHDGLGLLVEAGADLERAAADVNHQETPRGPAEPAPGGEEGQPRLVFAGQHPDARPCLVLDAGEHVVAVDRVADGRRGEGEEVLDALVLPDPHRLGDHLGQPRLADLRQGVAPLQVGGERKVNLVGERGQRPRPRVRVDDQQVHGIRADVEYPKSHDSDRTFRGGPPGDIPAHS